MKIRLYTMTFLLMIVSISGYAERINNFTVNNQTGYPISIQITNGFGNNSGWDDVPSGVEGVHYLSSYGAYTFRASDHNAGGAPDKLVIKINFRPLNAPYTITKSFAFNNPRTGDDWIDWYSDKLYFNSSYDHVGSIIINPNGDIYVKADSSAKSINLVNDTSAYRQYDDVYGQSKINLYDTYKNQMDKLPGDIKMVDVNGQRGLALISKGTISFTRGYGLTVQTTGYDATPNHSQPYCAYHPRNLYNSKLGLQTKKSKYSNYSSVLPEYNPALSMAFISLTSTITKQLPELMVASPSLYWNQSNIDYNSNYGFTLNSFDTKYSTVGMLFNANQGILDFDDKSKIEEKNVVSLINDFVNRTATNQINYSTSFSQHVSTSYTYAEKTDRTHAWKVAFKLVQIFDSEYSGNVTTGISTAQTSSEDNSITVPPQPVDVMPGCGVKVDVVLKELKYNGPYTLTTFIDDNPYFQITNPWKLLNDGNASVIKSGTILHAGEYIDSLSTSSNGYLKNRLIMQEDGNLVSYKCEDISCTFKVVLFTSGSVGKGAAYTVFQGDGNLVIYNSAGGAVWASNSFINSEYIGVSYTFGDSGLNLKKYHAFNGVQSVRIF